MIVASCYSPKESSSTDADTATSKSMPQKKTLSDGSNKNAKENTIEPDEALERYKDTEVIQGDLRIVGIENHHILADIFRTLKEIKGILVVSSIDGLESLEFLSSVRKVGGSVWLLDLPNLKSFKGIENIESMNVLKLQPICRHGTVLEIVNSFGGKKQYQNALKELEDQLYQAA